MTEAFLNQIIARGFACAGVLLAVAIVVKVVHYALTTTAPWV